MSLNSIYIRRTCPISFDLSAPVRTPNRGDVGGPLFSQTVMCSGNNHVKCNAPEKRVRCPHFGLIYCGYVTWKL